MTAVFDFGIHGVSRVLDLHTRGPSRPDWVAVHFSCGCFLHGNWRTPDPPSDVIYGWRPCSLEHSDWLDQGADAYQRATRA